MTYEIQIEPDTRIGFIREKPCLRVTVIQRDPWEYLGTERTKHVDQAAARALAAEMISRWEDQSSTISI